MDHFGVAPCKCSCTVSALTPRWAVNNFTLNTQSSVWVSHWQRNTEIHAQNVSVLPVRPIYPRGDYIHQGLYMLYIQISYRVHNRLSDIVLSTCSHNIIQMFRQNQVNPPPWTTLDFYLLSFLPLRLHLILSLLNLYSRTAGARIAADVSLRTSEKEG